MSPCVCLTESTCSTVSPGVISVNRLTLYETLAKVGVLSLASNTVTVTVTGSLCWTPSDATSCWGRDTHREKNKERRKRRKERKRSFLKEELWFVWGSRWWGGGRTVYRICPWHLIPSVCFLVSFEVEAALCCFLFLFFLPKSALRVYLYALVGGNESSWSL